MATILEAGEALMFVGVAEMVLFEFIALGSGRILPCPGLLPNLLEANPLQVGHSEVIRSLLRCFLTPAFHWLVRRLSCVRMILSAERTAERGVHCSESPTPLSVVVGILAKCDVLVGLISRQFALLVICLSNICRRFGIN